MSYVPLAHRRVWANAYGFTALPTTVQIAFTGSVVKSQIPHEIQFGLELKPRLKNGSARCGTLPDGSLGLRGAGTLLSVAILVKNGALTAQISASKSRRQTDSCAAPTRAVALRSSHRRMLRPPRMAGGDENSRVRAALPLRRGRLLSESWKPRKYRAGPWPGAAGTRRDSYFGDS